MHLHSRKCKHTKTPKYITMPDLFDDFHPDHNNYPIAQKAFLALGLSADIANRLAVGTAGMMDIVDDAKRNAASDLFDALVDSGYWDEEDGTEPEGYFLPCN